MQQIAHILKIQRTAEQAALCVSKYVMPNPINYGSTFVSDKFRQSGYMT
ncbi:hypothetical protein KC872_02095 [Candidatus Kaiserbacteria bacterium]|nr:hypothetical protein [Candidatus Kaiserbacteria bacterium]